MDQWLVVDPKGRKHHIVHDGDGWSGHENLAWFTIGAHNSQHIMEVLRHVSATPTIGEWGCYAWIKK